MWKIFKLIFWECKKLLIPSTVKFRSWAPSFLWLYRPVYLNCLQTTYPSTKAHFSPTPSFAGVPTPLPIFSRVILSSISCFSWNIISLIFLSLILPHFVLCLPSVVSHLTETVFFPRLVTIDVCVWRNILLPITGAQLLLVTTLSLLIANGVLSVYDLF